MRPIAAAVLMSGLLLTACGSEPRSGPTNPPSDTTATATAAPTPPASPSGTTIKVANSAFGMILYDATGQAIYLFDKEKSATPECYGACAEAWPPVLTVGTPQAAPGARADLLGTVARTDGKTQITYAGHPLYYYAHEGKNQVLCHNVREFGGLWLVVTPSGHAAPH